MTAQQTQGGGHGGQQQGLAQHQPGHFVRGRTQHAQHGQVGAAFAHGVPQGDKDTQTRREQQHRAKAAQHLGAHAHHAQQAGDFHGGRGGLHLGGGVDEARKGHCGQRAFVGDQGQGDFALLLQDFLVFLVQGGGFFVHFPDRFGGR